MNVVLVGNTDYAELALWAFFLFFIGLVIYLRREDHREGYPMEDDPTGAVSSRSLFARPDKTFILPHGQGFVYKPGKREVEPQRPNVARMSPYSGAPLTPTGNPLVDGVGPAAYAERARHPDLTWEGKPKIVPIGKTHGFRVARGDPNPVGMPVFGVDKVMAGVVTDIWVDQADRLIRYLEVRLTGEAGGRTVLAPMFMSQVNKRQGTITVDAIRADQFADAPAIAGDSEITLYEEDRIAGYYGGGYLYAMPSRLEPLL